MLKNLLGFKVNSTTTGIDWVTVGVGLNKSDVVFILLVPADHKSMNRISTKGPTSLNNQAL
jgi:hypothetical protein